MTRDQECGFCWFYPRWLRNRATARSFILVYGLLGTIQAMSFIYVVVTLTTLEKRFKIPSRTTGVILSGNEISQILSLVLIFYGGSGHRPRWIAVGVALSAVSCLVLALPHFIYGPGKDALALTKEYLDQSILNATSGHKDICPRIAGPETCDEDDRSDISFVPRLLVFLSQFILGIGTTLYYGLGQTYLDDNSKKKNTPMLLGFTLALRTVGPVFGFILGYFCMGLYIDPSLHPVITQNDPRWLGAWWLGWIILAVVMGFFGFLVALFPKELPRPQPRGTKKRMDGEIPLKLELVADQSVINPHEVRPNDVPNIKDFPKAITRLLTNRIVLFNNLSAVLYVLGVSGLITFLAKYLEVQYGMSPGEGTAIAGPVSMVGMVLGFLISGIVISKFKPRPRLILGWNVFVGFIFQIGTVTFIFLGCPQTSFQGLDLTTSQLNLSAACNAGCSCDGIKYSPVCHEATGTTYFSACHAGCTTTLNDIEFGSCACVAAWNTSRIAKISDIAQWTEFPGTENVENNSSALTEIAKLSLSIYDRVKAGPCPRNCSTSYTWFVALTTIIQIFACSGKIGNVLVNMRSVKPQDKSIAQGFSLMLISLLALIPGPIIYGAIIDSTCLIWEMSCGEKGNCWYYHTDNFRYLLNSFGAGFVFLGMLCDGAVWIIGKDLDFYCSSEEDKRREFVKTGHTVLHNEINQRSSTANRNGDPDIGLERRQ